MDNLPKRGFLREDFRLFHIKDQGKSAYELHCHDFYKIMVLLSGDVNYVIEGRSYHLEPSDIVLVGQGQLHRPEVESALPYERIILYLKPEFLSRQTEAPSSATTTDNAASPRRTADNTASPGNGISPSGSDASGNLASCFSLSSYRHSHVLRPAPAKRQALQTLLSRLEHSVSHPGDFAASLYSRLLCLEFLIELNRVCLAPDCGYVTSGALDYRISGLISYINDNLTEELSTGRLSEACSLSPYHMMRLFKSQTGGTIGGYITRKRLSRARELLSAGTPATDTCFACGFGSYSSFLRAYKQQYGELPRRTGR